MRWSGDENSKAGLRVRVRDSVAGPGADWAGVEVRVREVVGGAGVGLELGLG